eukprot:gene14821-biopygen6646
MGVPALVEEKPDGRRHHPARALRRAQEEHGTLHGCSGGGYRSGLTSVAMQFEQGNKFPFTLPGPDALGFEGVSCAGAVPFEWAVVGEVPLLNTIRKRAHAPMPARKHSSGGKVRQDREVRPRPR